MLSVIFSVPFLRLSAVAIAFLYKSVCILVLDSNNFRGQTIPSPDASG